MKFSLEATAANQIYDDDQIIISPEKQRFSLQLGASIIVTPNQIITNSKIDDITYKLLAPEVIIFSTGSTSHTPLAITLLELAKKSMGVEFMTLGAACRTYNLLVLENRHAILVISPSAAC